MFVSIGNFFAELKASATLGRASKLARRGRKEYALELAKSGLENLRKKLASRALVAQSGTHVALTIFAERLAKELGTTGAQEIDLQDALDGLKSLPKEKLVGALQASAEYLKNRLGQ
jgi:hypothetical protein